MNILIVSSKHPFMGGGRVAIDLYNGLREIKGNSVKLIVCEWDSYNDSNVIPVDNYFGHIVRTGGLKTKHALQKLGITRDHHVDTDPDYHVLDYDQTITRYKSKAILNRTCFKPDAVVVMFMHRFLTFKNLFEFNRLSGAPIYQLLMDMAPFTAGCHYAWACAKYEDVCSSCVAMRSYEDDDQSHRNWTYKHHYISRTDLTAIAAADHQWKQLQRSSLFKDKKKVKILSPTDAHLFRPGDKHGARRALCLPLDKRILFCGSVYQDKRKGYMELKAALHELFNMLPGELRNEFAVAIAGGMDGELKLEVPFQVWQLGYLSYERLALAYQAADVYLNSSIEDSGPTMINQAVMCGTPVVAFEMGVAPDLVRTGLTGYMARLKDPVDFANGIQSIASLPLTDYEAMSRRCRELALNLCSVSVVARSYQELFEAKTHK